MGLFSGNAGGRPTQGTPTPYVFDIVLSGGGVGVSNRPYERSLTPPLDSYRGRQGLQVARNMNTENQAFYIPQGSLVVSSVLNAAGANVTPDLISLFDPAKPSSQMG